MASPSPQKRCLARAGWLAVVLLAFPTMARANVGPPMSGGQIVAEPVGIKDIAITRETLLIDLRPLATGGLARVEAVYRLHNDGSEKKLDLLFASGSGGTTHFEVRLDDQSVASAPAPSADLPASWRPPESTPGIGDGSGLGYLPRQEQRDVTPVGFAVVIPPGSHTLKVSYAAKAASYLSGNPTVYRQFAYVLAPARAWAGFGGLDVTILLPENWRAACTPALARTGDTLEGSFADLPADAIALTVQAPEGWAYQPLVYGSLGLFGLVAFGGAGGCFWGGRSRGRVVALRASGGRRCYAWPTSFALSVAWGLAVLGAGLLAVFGPEWVLPAGQVSRYGYGSILATIGVFILSRLAVPVGFGIAQLAAFAARREATNGRV